jgi:hypothetical protein
MLCHSSMRFSPLVPAAPCSYLVAYPLSSCLACVQDLSKLNRDLSRVIFVSGHGDDACAQPENLLAIKPWKMDQSDTALLDHLPFLECEHCLQSRNRAIRHKVNKFAWLLVGSISE